MSVRVIAPYIYKQRHAYGDSNTADFVIDAADVAARPDTRGRSVSSRSGGGELAPSIGRQLPRRRRGS